MSVPIFVSTYITGFQNIVVSLLTKNLLHCEIVDCRDGIVFYTTKSRIHDIIKLPYLNNSYLLLYESKRSNTNLKTLMEEIIQNTEKWLTKLSLLPGNLSYRIKGFIENEPYALPKHNVKTLESLIQKRYKNYVIDVNNPGYEFWISLRKDEKGLCLLRLTKKNSQKGLQKGELRSEFSYLLSSFTYFKNTDIIIDPFAGYGSIPKIISQYFPYHKLIVNDINHHCIDYCKKSLNKQKNIVFLNQDALHLDAIQNNSVNHIITDPPWGFFEQIQPSIDVFYEDIIQELKRIIKSDGTLTICTAQKEITKNLLQKYHFSIQQEIHTLISGKKVVIYFSQNQ